MKKLSLVLAILIVFSCMPYSVVRAEEPYKEVIDLINDIGEVTEVDAAQKTKIDTARTAYLELEPEIRKKVTNFSVLKKSMEDYYD